MTQQEFQERTGIAPTMEEFDYIHAVYMNTSMDKDEFCKDFKRHGTSKIISDIHARVVNFKLQITQKDEYINDVVDFLIGKSRAYDDTDFRRVAIRLVGEREVVLRTLHSGMPLWQEDREFIENELRR